MLICRFLFLTVFSDLHLILILMLQKLEFLSELVVQTDVTVIFFWILVILHYTLRYASWDVRFSVVVLWLGIFLNYSVFSQESQSDEQRQNLYSRFYISGRDIAAFFTDCGSDFGSCSLVKPNYDSQIMNSPVAEKDENVYSLIDRCGMAVLVNQVCLLYSSNCSVVIFWTTI